MYIYANKLWHATNTYSSLSACMAKQEGLFNCSLGCTKSAVRMGFGIITTNVE